MLGLRPFWRYYGGKWRAAPRYPQPRYSTIIEPFAGAAGYSLRYYDRNVILVDRYEVIAGIWRYLIAARSDEIRRIPLVETVDDLPAWVPQEARWLVGFHLNSATASPCKIMSSGMHRMIARGYDYYGWFAKARERVASQVDLIHHWQIIEGDYWDAPDVEATWFVDPPYANAAGKRYKCSSIDYDLLAYGCRCMQGQVVVCENGGARWLPFRPFLQLSTMSGRKSNEVIWTNDAPP